jgi:CubicO group peptidase (beta-lactamase class C family)
MHHSLRAWLAPLLIGSLAIAGAHASEAPLSPQVQEKIDAAAHAIVESKMAPGIAVGVVRSGQLVFNRSYGSANLEQNVPVSDRTVFRLASLTKQFTAASVLLLIEQKKLSLDDRLAKFYPDFPRGAQITIRHLLNHTSGIHDYPEDLLGQLAPREWATPELAKRLATIGFDFDPGTHWSYSNSGYFLLGQIIEKVSGETFAQFTKAHLFAPLGMTDTAVDSESDVVPWRAAGYSKAKDTASGFINAPFIPMSVVYAAGATRSTVRDLAKWNIALYGGRVMSAESFKLMTTQGRVNDGRPASDAIYKKPGAAERAPHPGFGPMGYTMGLHTGTLDGHAFMGHEGGIFGFSTIIENYRDDGFMLIILSNAEGAAGLLEMQTARIMFGQAIH